MRLINLSELGNMFRIEFAGCNMKCPYCVHIHQPFTNRTIEEVVEVVKGSKADTVYLGGAEPTIQKELIPLLEALQPLGKRVLLKSNGMKPDVLENSLPFVDGFVIEIKSPLDDIDGIMELTGMSRERTLKYIDMLNQSLEIAKNKWLRVWIRVIPEYVNEDTVPGILPSVEGASEVMLYQFLSNPDFDKPFMNHDSPVPAWSTMEALGWLMLDTIPRVVILGEMGKVVLEK